jgi:hypothetical protein
MSRFVEAEELARSPLEQAAGRVLALGEVRP